ncbi:nicotinamide riboside transporter PnuC [uncultured Flavobacterium sp.]|uniref:nicotinamide riboside transporter PnuC n=1 Tax=uncultured Flavobacterium sp. TaxID=165435 RepID=UPI0030CA5166|tara:strand:- start:1766 stop:2380 length:615 start_codon:yes stop_codon:yes gene_type:complete
MLDFLFGQYKTYSNIFIVFELIAIIFGIWSVFLAKKNSILVFPVGLVSTFIFVYLLYNWGLLGDMLINIYYSGMSIYAWLMWAKKKQDKPQFPISKTTKKEFLKGIVVFLLSLIFVLIVYKYFNKLTHWTAYVDAFTTGIFFVGMWLMAKRKLENWILWIIGDIISIPLYFYKGYTFTSLQYLVFTIIALFGYIQWKKYLAKQI